MTQEELNRIIDSDSYFAARKDPSEAEFAFSCVKLTFTVRCVVLNYKADSKRNLGISDLR